MERDTLYQRIYDQLLSDIHGGRYKSGDRLPSEKDLAETFGVSRITTKRALGMLMEQGYIERFPGRGSFVRGGGAATLRDHASAIGLIVPDFSESFGMNVIRGAEQAAQELGYAVLLRLTRGDVERENDAVQGLLDMDAAGIAITPVHNEYHNPTILRLVLETYPLVLVDRRLEGIQTPFVGIDNYRAAYDAARYLLDHGHTRIAYCSITPSAASTLRARFKGFREAFKHRGLTWDEALMMSGLHATMPHNNPMDSAREEVSRMAEFFREHTDVTCVFATEYHLARMAYAALEGIGRRIPEDVSILGFDGPTHPYSDAFLTRMMQPEAKIGRAAIKALHRQIAGEPGELEEQFYAQLVEGRSVRDLR